MATLSLHVDAALHQQLCDLAELADRSKSYIIRKALKQFLAEYPIPNAKTRKVIDDARKGKNLSKVEDFSAFLDTL